MNTNSNLIDSEARKLYEQLTANKQETHHLGENMAVVEYVLGQYWKPCYLLNLETKCAYQFMNRNETLATITMDDILWEQLMDEPEEVIERAKRLSFHFPSFIYPYQNGVAHVKWQLNPDGRYYEDEDGYGMTDDKECNIYGFIDKTGKVLVKFRPIKNEKELETLRLEAEKVLREKNE